jgi:hypothetical protein
MPKLLLRYSLALFCCTNIIAQTYTDTEARSAWNELKKKPLNEQNFRAACDLMQTIGKTNLTISYEMLGQYVPMVRSTGDRRWEHILLMGWAKAKECCI